MVKTEVIKNQVFTNSALGILIFSVKFYQLFAKTIRWSLESLKNWKISKKKLIWIPISVVKKEKEDGLGFFFSKCVQLNKQTNKQTKKLKNLKKFYQLFATVLRWSLEKFEKKIPRLSFVWREGGRKEEKSLTNKQTKKIWKSKENSLTNKQTNKENFKK